MMETGQGEKVRKENKGEEEKRAGKHKVSRERIRVR